MHISNKTSLSVLNTAMYIAKWESDEKSSRVIEIAGSPLFANLYNEMIDEMIRPDADNPDIMGKWERWRAIEHRPDQLERMRVWIKGMRPWSGWSREQKLRMIEYLLSPFRATDATIAELLSL